jgi:hypothetical protein
MQASADYQSLVRPHSRNGLAAAVSRFTSTSQIRHLVIPITV